MSRNSARLLIRAILITLMLLLPISQIGCTKRYVVVEGDETVTVRKSTIDTLYADNEALLKALEDCQGKDSGFLGRIFAK
jgi:hypothetical protein